MTAYGSRQFIRDQEFPQDWARRLGEISPESAQHSWLSPRWFSEAQRWLLYECVPEAHIKPDALVALTGPDPDTREGAAWAESISYHISHYQWTMYRAHRVHARPYWVLQGTKGGHLVAMSDEAARLCRLANEYRPEGVVGAFPDQMPAPGDLPACPFDERTVAHLVAGNALLACGNDLAEFRRLHAGASGVKRQRTEREKQYRRTLLKWLNDQLEEPVSHFARAEATGQMSEQRAMDRGEVAALDARSERAEAEFADALTIV